MARRHLRALALFLGSSALAGSGSLTTHPQGEGSWIEESIEGSTTVLEAGADLAGRAGPFWRYQSSTPAPAVLSADSRDWVEIELTRGQRLSGLLQGGHGDDLLCRVGEGLLVPVALDDLRSLVLTRRTALEGALDLQPAAQGDRLYRRRGESLDRIDGLVQTASEEGIAFDSNLGRRTFPWDEVAALFVEPLAEEEAQGVTYVADLVGGNRLRGTLAGADEHGITLRWGTLARELRIPGTYLIELARDDGSWRALGDLTIADAGPVSPFGDDLGATWPPRIDRTVLGLPIEVAGRAIGRGIGVHAPSRIRWELGGAYSGLRLGAAVEAVPGGSQGGSVRFLVRVDDELRYESPVCHAGESIPALPPIPLAGARQLVLEVDPTEDSFVLDRALWLRPLLLPR